MNATLIDTYPDEGPDVTLQFRLPDQDGKYYFHFHAFARGRATESSATDYLILMNKNGKISDYLKIGMNFAITGFTTMDFQIDREGTIHTSQFRKDSDPATEDDIDFIGPGKRIEQTYKIENGKFVLKNTRTYPQKVYRMLDLVNGRFISDTKETSKEDDFFL